MLDIKKTYEMEKRAYQSSLKNNYYIGQVFEVTKLALRIIKIKIVIFTIIFHIHVA